MQEHQLYRDLGYKTFEDYCWDRWEYGRRMSYYLIDAAQVMDNLCTMVHKLPANEAQARALVALGDDRTLQQLAWLRAVESAPDGKVTTRICCNSPGCARSKQRRTAMASSTHDSHTSGDNRERNNPMTTTTPEEKRLTEIQETIADERDRMERGDDARLESLAPLLSEMTRLTQQIEGAGIQLTEKQFEEAAKRVDFAAYEYSRIATNEELMGKIEALRAQGDVVGLYLITSQMPKGALRSLAERPLLDTKTLNMHARRDAARLEHLRWMSPEKRAENYALRQGLPTITEDELIARKRAQLGGL